jgi:hypothetical protein
MEVLYSSDSERKEWFTAIREAIEKVAMLPDKSSRNSVIAPLWVPDFKSSHCSLCSAAFTIIFRRHHCRNCGKLVCTNCSPRRFVLINVSDDPVRVCTPCFESLDVTDVTSIPATEHDRESSDDDSDFEERSQIGEDALEDFNDFEEQRLKHGLPAEKVADVCSPVSQLQTVVVRKTFFSNLAAGLASATSALRPANATTTKVENRLLKQSRSPQTTVPPTPPSPPTIEESPRFPPRRPRRPNTLTLVPLQSAEV